MAPGWVHTTGTQPIGLTVAAKLTREHPRVLTGREWTRLWLHGGSAQVPDYQLLTGDREGCCVRPAACAAGACGA